jgi:hypothetical protein
MILRQSKNDRPSPPKGQDRFFRDAVSQSVSVTLILPALYRRVRSAIGMVDNVILINTPLQRGVPSGDEIETVSIETVSHYPAPYLHPAEAGC